ncbi:hypothetical protein [Nitratireductor pacificus]|uniref:Integrase catalytic subunit n=1 Tax=Nitratireductor pacificus pht-3B TaxID=391937 RepID=K2M9M5_9HYPH|nr:hypothetical protein [Nitratireductor pacificus]EKF17700.1 integrase catalytic subunit [Nitratireductor pacificus pht-3B]
MAAQDSACVPDITYIRSLESFANLVVVTDLYPHRVVGVMQSRQATDVVLQALHMVVWRCKPKQQMLTFGSELAVHPQTAFIRGHNLEHSMS